MSYNKSHDSLEIPFSPKKTKCLMHYSKVTNYAYISYKKKKKHNQLSSLWYCLIYNLIMPIFAPHPQRLVKYVQSDPTVIII